jgi:DNA polymerase-3 subunit delta'
LAAKAFAAALQCDTGVGCGQCHPCRQVLTGAHPDVALIVPEGLSISVRDARRIILRSAHAPTLGRWQVTLIEDADRLTDDASNALLKALEEPAAHSVLLLSAPSAEDLLPTIRSAAARPAADPAR